MLMLASNEVKMHMQKGCQQAEKEETKCPHIDTIREWER